MKNNLMRLVLGATLLWAMAIGGAVSGWRGAAPEKSAARPAGRPIAAPAQPVAVPRNPDRDAFFGETHVHTSWSFDAYIFGNTVTGPDDAYKYALGQPVKHPAGYM